MKLRLLLLTVSFFGPLAFANPETETEIKNQKLKIIKVTTLEKKNQKEAEHLERENAKLLKELEALKAKIPALEDNVKSLDGVVKAGRDENTRLREVLEDQKKLKAEMEEKITKLTKERADLKDTYTRSMAGTLAEEKQIREKRIELEKQEVLTKDEQGRLEKETEKLKKELKIIQAQSEARENSLNKSKDVLKSTRGTLSELKDKRDSLNKSIAESDEVRKKSAEEIQELTKEITKLKAEISNIKIRADVAKHNQQDAANSYKIIAKEAAQLRAINTDENTKLKKIEEEVTDLQGLIKTGKEEIERAKKEYEGLTKRGRQAKTEKPKLEAQLAQLKITYSELIERNRRLRKKE